MVRLRPETRHPSHMGDLVRAPAEVELEDVGPPMVIEANGSSPSARRRIAAAGQRPAYFVEVATSTMIADWNRKGIQFKRVISSPSLEVITELTRAGAGVGLLPTRVANRVPDLKLLTYSKSVPTYNDELCVVYRPDRQKAQAAKVILEEIQKSVR